MIHWLYDESWMIEIVHNANCMGIIFEWTMCIHTSIPILPGEIANTYMIARTPICSHLKLGHLYISPAALIQWNGEENRLSKLKLFVDCTGGGLYLRTPVFSNQVIHRKWFEICKECPFRWLEFQLADLSATIQTVREMCVAVLSVEKVRMSHHCNLHLGGSTQRSDDHFMAGRRWSWRAFRIISDLCVRAAGLDGGVYTRHDKRRRRRPLHEQAASGQQWANLVPYGALGRAAAGAIDDVFVMLRTLSKARRRLAGECVPARPHQMQALKWRQIGADREGQCSIILQGCIKPHTIRQQTPASMW